ncbi:MAG: O-antigen ligase family protein [Bacteroidota bacterium]
MKKISLSEIFHYICLYSIIAACVLLFEVLTYTHLQTYTGYADYNYYFFGQEPSGDYGLTWTFQIENGMKRFASFFSAPLEYAAATLISVSALAALMTDDRNKLKANNFTIVATASSLFAICFALSRASFASYFVIIYSYAWIIRNRIILKIFHYGILAAAVFFLFVTIKGDFFQFILNTVQFTNESSVGHVIEWLNGVQSMVKHPLGIGLGESGRISAFSGYNTGGENQFIILGVQVGVIALAVYIFMYIKLVAIAFHNIKVHKGRLRKLSLFIFLIKMGLLIPLFTAEVETYIYISYLVWFLSGLLINMTSEQADMAKQPNTLTDEIVYS